MNLPLDTIHCENFGYGWLLLKWLGGWIALRDKTKRIVAYDSQMRPMINGYELRFAKDDSFHNCSAVSRQVRRELEMMPPAPPEMQDVISRQPGYMGDIAGPGCDPTTV